MRNYSKINKRKIIFTFLLTLNQLILSGYTFNNKKIESTIFEKNNFQKQFKSLISNKSQDETNFIEKESEELEKFVDETFNQQNSDQLKELQKINPIRKSNIKNLDQNTIKKDIENKESSNDEERFIDNPQNKKKTSMKVIYQKNTDKLPLPSKSTIYTSQFKVPSRGYVKLNGPKISLNLKDTEALEALKLISKLGGYGIIIIGENNSLTTTLNITANFEKADISDVFNSILLSADLQAVVENNIIFVGTNILNKSIKEKISKTFRLNQVNAASVADYLSTLGAQISKVMVVSGSMDGQEIGDGLINKKEFKDELVKSYVIDKGPLYGLVGTADLRLQTITLIGSKDKITTAEKFIESLDVRHRQVALTIKIIDVSLTKSDIKNNVFEFTTGDTRFISNAGLGLVTGNTPPGNPADTANVPNIITGGLAEGNFMSWLEAKITNENAKILASPTLILGENPNFLTSGSASIDDSLSAATIGRPFKNEGFIKVGETVVTGFTQTATDGVVTCTATEGTAGITFGAKVDKIDDNGYVNFALSPAISSVTKSVEISGCGIQNTLSVRKLDTGSIRVKNGETLILSGVLQDSDTVTTSKIPILGDIPVFGSLFRSNSAQKRKSELIILVTPKILKDK